METAGRAVASVVALTEEAVAMNGILVATGAGNNGGDGWVAARTLHRQGYRVAVVSAGIPQTADAIDARRVALADGVVELSPDQPWPQVGLVIDALLGGGAHGPPREPIASLLSRIGDLDRPIIAVDGPSGLDLADGTDHGALNALATVTFGGARRGQLLARDLIGELYITEIGHPAAVEVWPVLVDNIDVAEWLRPFGANDHKGVRGRVVVVGGSSGMTGAGRFVARAAFAAGAGLVHVVTDPEAATELALAEPDVQVRVRVPGKPLADEVVELIAGADVVVLGPGLGRGAAKTRRVDEVARHARRVLLDADALHAFSGRIDELAAVAERIPVILTPHPGEFEALFPDIDQRDRWHAVNAASQRTGATVLLKGVPTVIASAGRPIHTVARGNPGLATGGSGDVLSGTIGALWCGTDDPMHAAAIGAMSLGRAAELAAMRFGLRGMRPMQVIQELANGWRDWGSGEPALFWPGTHLPRVPTE